VLELDPDHDGQAVLVVEVLLEDVVDGREPDNTGY
jgi:hypothetical protein